MTIHPGRRHPPYRHTRGRSALIGALVFSVLFSASPDARADSCDTPMSEHESERAVNSVDELPVEQLMPALEALDQCDNLQRMTVHLNEQYDHYRRVLAGILLVTSVGRDPSNADSDQLLHAAQLIDSLSFTHQKRAMMDYALEKLAQDPDNEPLFAFLDGPTPTMASSAIKVMVAGTSTGEIAPGPWAPPHGQPIPFYIGNEAHRMIARYYRQANGDAEIAINSIAISATLRALAKQGIGPAANKSARAKGKLALRPDIVNLTTQEIYEIKPAGRIAEAEAQVKVYIAAFQSAGVTMVPGRSNAPGTVGAVPAPAGHYRFWSPTPGVIVYRYHRGAYAPARAPSTVPTRIPGLTPFSVPARRTSTRRPATGIWAHAARATGLTGTALVMYVILSTGSRVIPARNLVPIP